MADGIDPRRQASSVLLPRFRMLADGEPVSGFEDVVVRDNNFLAADTWTVRLALGLDARCDAAFWADGIDTEVEILAAFVPEGTPEGNDLPWKSLIVGGVDDYDLDPVSGTVELKGRDKTGDFIDAQIIESFPNKTASEIATLFAGRHGMEADVTPTQGRIGQHYAKDHMGSASMFSQSRSEWDLLTWLAQQEGYEIWVEGRTLHFKPARQTDAQPTRIVCSVGEVERGASWAVGQPTAITGAIAEHLKRSSRAARDIQVTVESRDAKGAVNARATVRGRSRARAYQQRQPTGRRRSSGTDPEAPASVYQIPLEGDPNEGRRSSVSRARGRQTVQAPPTANAKISKYRFTVTGANEAECLKQAQAKLEELSAHERIVELTMPGELALDARASIALEGTGTSFDQQYWVHEVERTFSVENGFTQHLVAKNTSPRDIEQMSGDGDTATPLSGAGTSRAGAAHRTPQARTPSRDEIPVPPEPEE